MINRATRHENNSINSHTYKRYSSIQFFFFISLSYTLSIVTNQKKKIAYDKSINVHKRHNRNNNRTKKISPEIVIWESRKYIEGKNVITATTAFTIATEKKKKKSNTKERFIVVTLNQKRHAHHFIFAYSFIFRFYTHFSAYFKLPSQERWKCEIKRKKKR